MYKFYADPAHGWLEVPTQELHDLGIAGKISSYSYISRARKMSYLEEDCDVRVYLEALGYYDDWHGFWDRKVTHVYLPSDACGNIPHHIRNCPAYSEDCAA